MSTAALRFETTPLQRSLTLLAHAAFIPVGMATVVLGPLLPLLSARWSLGYTHSGYLFTAQFVGAALGVGVSGWVIERWGYRVAMIAGLSFIGAGLAVLPSVGFGAGLVAILFYGAAIGLMGPTCNLLVAEIHPANSGAALNLLNFSWGVGAVSCPFLIAATMRAQKVTLALRSISVAALLVGIAILTIRSCWTDGPRPLLRRNELRVALNWRQPVFFILSALFLLYVGVENGIGGWLASYAHYVAGGTGRLGVMSSSFFYLALLVGRFMAPVALRKISEINLARCGLVVACLAIIGLLWIRNMAGLIVFTSLAGLGLSSVFPITIARMSRQFGASSPRAGSILFNMANIGGATLPLLVGFTSQTFGSLSWGLLIVFASTLMILALYFNPVNSAQDTSLY